MFFEREKKIKVEKTDKYYEVKVSFIDEYHNIELITKSDFDLNILNSKAILNNVPYKDCYGINLILEKAKDIKIESGFTKKISEIVGGRNGCTHLIDMFQETGRALVQANLKSIYQEGGSNKLSEALKDTCTAY